MSAEAASRRVTSSVNSRELPMRRAATSASPMEEAVSPSVTVTSADWPGASSSTCEPAQPRKAKKHTAAITTTATTAAQMKGAGDFFGMMALVS